MILHYRLQEREHTLAPQAAHTMIARLCDTGRLVRNYTQNIDGLESKAGISRYVCLQHHAVSRLCSAMVCYMHGRMPDVCLARVSKDEAVSIVLRDICFFEDPVRELDNLELDMAEAGTLLVLGSSLKVSPSRCGLHG